MGVVTTIPLMLGFGLFTVILWLIALWLRFGTTDILIDDTNVIRSMDLFGFTYYKEIPIPTIAKLDIRTGSQTGERAYFTIIADCGSSKNVLIDGIADKNEARHIVNTITYYLGQQNSMSIKT